MELLERQDPLAQLIDGFERMQVGPGHSFYIYGEAGIGKSSLVNAFLAAIGDQAKICTALCDSLFTPRPLGPLYDLLSQLHAISSDTPDAGSGRSEVFAVFMNAISKQVKPVVIFIEDVHWADEATLDFIKFLARRITNYRCLLLLTCRDNEVSPAHALRNVLGEIPAAFMTRLPLQPLSRTAVQKLTLARGYNGEDVFQVTGGNPFFVQEIIASYSTGVPENIRDSILSVYNRKAPATRKAWELLSVMPEGIDVSWLDSIDPNFQSAVEDCVLHGILITRNDRLLFKHELYRRTIESSMSELRHRQLNKQILSVFLQHFIAGRQLQRVVHYAKNAGDKNLVLIYAPLAASAAAEVGAHVEAAKLYLAALEYAQDEPALKRVVLFSAYTYECYLTSQIREAITYQEKVVAIWKEQGDKEKTGDNLRFLSRLWWFQGHQAEAHRYAHEAIDMLTGEPPSKAKAMAYSNLSQLKMLAEELDECISWGQRAIDMATAIGDQETLCHALNNVGTVRTRIPAMSEEGIRLLHESLQLALTNGFHEHAARAYTNIISHAISLKRFEIGQHYLAEGLQYCEERDLHSWVRYNLSWQAKLYLQTAKWDEALVVARALLENPSQPGIIRVGALVVCASILMRRGSDDAKVLLKEARELAFVANEHQRVVPLFIACMEYEWLSGESLLNTAEYETAFQLIAHTDNRYLNSEAIFWIALLPAAQPLALRAGIAFGKEHLDSSLFEDHYLSAIASFNGNENDKRAALVSLQKIGAEQVCRKLTQLMRSMGVKKIPRGLRASTRANAGSLTTREVDILQLLKTGAKNKEIAATLFISPKTVDHHISSILFKLDAGTRLKAVSEAERLGFL